jgi:hypothetical protein
LIAHAFDSVHLLSFLIDEGNAARGPQFRQTRCVATERTVVPDSSEGKQPSLMRHLETHPWFSTCNDLVKLGIESQAVIAARCAIVQGAVRLRPELQRMFWEKVAAYGEASAMLFWGAHPRKIVRRYRRHVRSNKRRLRK